MAAVISHEIRNPLGIIFSSAELLKKKMTKIEPNNTIPDIIVAESTRLNNIITDFLNFARPRSPRLAPCRVEDVLEKNINFLAPQMKSQGHNVHISLDGNLPEVMADADMLYQAFLNIFINALQAMPASGEISIRVQPVEGAVQICFSDQGAGVPEDLLEKIWDPYFTTKDKGTGLGLGIVKNIIDAHGGDIRIENIPEGGARVVVLLPLKRKG